jgi:CheY-like chemotaxis protein
LDILRWHLHKQGYEVAAARDGAEALAMIAELRAVPGSLDS